MLDSADSRVQIPSRTAAVSHTAVCGWQSRRLRALGRFEIRTRADHIGRGWIQVHWDKQIQRLCL